ncbi:unnamed protein product [Darwinula stevensoni]|uniref:CS domain-containing protein n=1 Tax=Darwinula stevensoni TaxID=69355 RepID=A0A7R8X3E6_9CRUS|nr:unnamed protein product [Darwinula stevensoni]CAG0884281.1 unnamed protein product [Darwinula stevensoni]
MSELSHFDERSGVVECKTPWGTWYQTVAEVHIQVKLPPGTKGKEVSVRVTPSSISCHVRGNEIFKGPLHKKVVEDETVWTVEDGGSLLHIVLTKVDSGSKDQIWASLLQDLYAPDPFTFQEMRKKLDLERFQIEHPGFDFSGAQLDKGYDQLPPEVLKQVENPDTP